MACAETGHLDDATRIARWAIGADGTAIQPDLLWVGAHSLFCGVAARAGDVELAEMLYDILAPCSEHIVVFGSGGAMLGPVHYWRGIAAATAGNLDAAIDHLEAAIVLSEAMRAPFWAAQARVDLAAALRRGRGSESAAVRELLHRAVATARPRGFGRVLRQAQAGI